MQTKCDCASKVSAVSFPLQCGISHLYPARQLADAFAIALPAGASTDAETLARFIFSHQPAWVGA